MVSLLGLFISSPVFLDHDEDHAGLAVFNLSTWFTLALTAQVHSAANILYVIAFVACVAVTLGPGWSITCFFFGIVCTLMGLASELQVATLWFDLSCQQSANDSLLDHLTNGVAVVEATTGVIRSASDRFQHTFASNGLEGQSMLDLCLEDGINIICLTYF